MPCNCLRPSPEGAHGHRRVTNIELFFGLTFVSAVAQLSRLLASNFILQGGAQALLLMLAVWWMWIFALWVTSRLGPDKLAIRMPMLVLVTDGLLLSASLSQAFGSHELAFALAYVFMRFGRTVFFMWAVRGEPLPMWRNFQRIVTWLGIPAVLWLAGSLSGGSTHWACWIFMLVIGWLGSSMGFYTPGLGHSTASDWNVEGGHMAERRLLFIIIALDESALVTGSTFVGLVWTAENVAAMTLSFISSLAMWWLYFGRIAERGACTMSHSADPGRLTRLAYAYIHVVLVAGIIVGAVADEFVLAHPVGRAREGTTLAVLGSTTLYLLDNLLFKWAIFGQLHPTHAVGLVVLGDTWPPVGELPALTVSTLATGVLYGTATWEWYTHSCETTKSEATHNPQVVT